MSVHPYRQPPDAEARERIPIEDWALAGGLLVIGGVRVIVAIAQGEAFATEATLASIMVIAGLMYAIRLATSASAPS